MKNKNTSLLNVGIGTAVSHSVIYNPNSSSNLSNISISPNYHPYQSMEFGDHKFKIKLTLNNPDDWVKMAEMFSRLMSDAEIKHTVTYIEEGVEVHKSDR